MTTEQKFFTNIVHSNAITYSVLRKIVGDLKKQIGISANFYEEACLILGNTISENYDLVSLFYPYQQTLQSNNSDLLRQSLQNVNLGVINTSNIPQFDVCTHISTSIYNYSFGVSSSFLSAQIFSFNAAGIGTSAVISVPITDLQIYGNQFNSHLFDVPIDVAIYGNDNFSGSNYTNSNLIKFDYCWSYAQQTANLLISLNYKTPPISDYYLSIYWGTNQSSFISTNYSIQSGLTYVGTNNFISNIGVLTTSVINSNLTNVSDRKNFWSNNTPYSLGFVTNSYVDTNPFLWADGRINAILIDGIYSNSEQPLRYPVFSNSNFSSYISGNQNFIYLYSDFITSGTKNDLTTNATLQLQNLFSTNYSELININNVTQEFEYEVPGSFFVLQKNPKKINLANSYSIIQTNQIVPSAFVRTIENVDFWKNFAFPIISAKSYYLLGNQTIGDYLNTLDNFIADLFFGVNFNNVNDFFTGQNLIISKNTLKDFTQPYGTNNVPPLNFSRYEEDSIYESTNIVSSKEYLTFNSGKLTKMNDYNLPIDTPFEIYKPISYVCNGIDPYNQGTGLALDYTLNLTFRYSNQNKLNKILYLMASKYVISKSDYDYRIENNQETTGYYYIANPDSTDYNDYSVSSIDEFRLYGYSGIIPDLKDGVVRPIQTKAFSPIDTTKYTYEEYVAYLQSQGITNPDDINDAVQAYLDAGNSFYVVNLNKFPSAWVSLEDISICASNYVINKDKYWNLFNQREYLTATVEGSGFTKLNAVINSGLITSITQPPPYSISNIPVGYNNIVDYITINSFGSLQLPGSYSNWVLPPAASRSNESPAQIKFNILSSGALDPSSVEIVNPGGGFSFGFSTYLYAPFSSTGIGTTNAYITLNMDNLSYFNATVDSNYILTSFTQSKQPSRGYNTGFKFNSKALVGLGYTAFTDIDILIDDYSTTDSFLISNTNLQPGDLENYTSFENPYSNFDSINFSSGSQIYTLYEDELLNEIIAPYNYGFRSINYITINCKLIELDNRNPSGYIKAIIYSGTTTNRVVVSSSNEIPVSLIPRKTFSSLNIPIDFTFTNTIVSGTENKFWLSIQQNLKGSFLSLIGSFTGITTSNFSVDNSLIYNDPNTITVFGGITTSGFDLDLGKTKIGITSIFVPSILTSDQNSANIYLRKNIDYNGTNKVALALNTTYLGQTNFVTSNYIDVTTLSTTFVASNFIFNSPLVSGTIVNYGNLITEKTLSENQIFISRSLSQYDGSQLGMATSSQIGFANTYVNFNFVFNKLFTEVSNEIYAAFNYTDYSQFGLAQPNKLREIDPVVVVDGYWAYKSKDINNSLSIYPRAIFDINTIVGSSSPQYEYIGYSHDIYVNLGYNSSGVYKEELIILNASPKWKVTWMDRSNLNYKNFSLFNVVQQTYENSINYQVGLANTIIGFSTSAKSAIFSGTFQPTGNLASTVPVSVTIGTSSGVQLFINNNTEPRINSFTTISTGITTFTTTLSLEERANPVIFDVNYFTLSTASINIKWNVGSGNTLINLYSSSNSSLATPVDINSGLPVDNIVFMNISKTLSEARSIDNGYPPGDSFVIRSS